jgi:tetratricopeptide (TPR) repeat protein
VRPAPADLSDREHSAPSPWARYGPALAVVLLAIAAYANALANGFAQDDSRLIEENLQIRSLWNLPTLFASDLFQGAYPAAMYYRPLVLASFALEYAFAGPLPAVYHLTNIVLHALVCLLLYVLVRRLFAAPTLALVAAALFAVHPVHTEAVTAISGRGDLLGTLFILAGALLYATPAGPMAPRRMLAALACMALALLSKESSLIAITLLPLSDLVRREVRPVVAAREALRERAPFWIGLAILVALYGVAREVATASDVSMSQLGFLGNRHGLDTPLALKLASCAKVLGLYFRLLVFPYELSADYDFNQVPLATSAFTAASVLPGLALIALLTLGVGQRRKDPALFFGIASLLLTLLPIAFALPFANFPPAERYLYFSSLGLCIGIAAIVVRVPARAQVACLSLLFCLVILPGAARTALRNRDWRDDHSLWAATIETSPNSSKAQANRALSLSARAEEAQSLGDLDRARELFRESASHYERAVAIDPFVPGTRIQYGLCLAALGRYERAEVELTAAAELGLVEARLALYRMLITQSRLHAESFPPRARGFQRRAERLFRDQIRPISPPGEAAVLVRELEALDRELRGALRAAEEAR